MTAHLQQAGFFLIVALLLGCGGVWLLSGHDRMQQAKRKSLGRRRNQPTRKDHR